MGRNRVDTMAWQHTQRIAVRLCPEPRPEDGDIVIGRPEGSPTAFALRVVPRPFQITCGQYDEALAHARAFAAAERIDVWVAEENGRFAIVARYRRERAAPDGVQVRFDDQQRIDALS